MQASAPLQADAIVVTAIGMNSSLGQAVTACAAARTGLSLARELDFSVVSSDGEDSPVLGHPVHSASGFRGIGKLFCLALPAVADLLSEAPACADHLEKTCLYLCLPDATSWSRRAAEPRDDESVTQQPSCGPDLSARLTRRTPLAVPERSWMHTDLGHAGVVQAIHDATAKLAGGSWQRCVIGAVDSLLEENTLGWLLHADRLKTPDRPDGLQPGEAAVFVAIERYDVARRRNAEILAVVEATSIVHADGRREDGADDNGSALSRAMATVMTPARDAPGADFWLISDHNGEHRRARELGTALVRLAAQNPRVRAAARWYPAQSFGDTGAASAAIAVSAACRAFARGYAPAGAAIVMSSSTNGTRASARLRRPPNP